MGYEPIMSEYSDILYDTRSHTHDSCLKEIPAADMVVLIIGSRFGGVAIPAATSHLDFSILEKLSSRSELLENKEKLSVTQLEVLKAVEQSIPVYAFVEDTVMHDHHVYEKNKDKKDFIDKIEFPSIQKRETAKYIFEFINFLTHRVTNNSVTTFGRLDDIRSHLAIQWSQMFQRLLLESRTRINEERRYRDFAESLEDLKAVVLASLATPDLRNTAKGAIQFRRLISFISSLVEVDHRALLLSNGDWNTVLESAKIIEIRSEDAGDRLMRSDLFLIRSDGTFYRARISPRILEDMRIDWNGFLNVEVHTREAIADALLEDRETRRFPLLVYIPKTLEEYQAERAATAERTDRDFEKISVAPIIPIRKETAAVDGLNPEQIEVTIG